MNRTGRHTARVLTQTSALAIAAVLALSACGGSGEDAPREDTQSEAAPSEDQNQGFSAEENTEETEAPDSTDTTGGGESTDTTDTTDAGAGAAEGTEVKVGTEFTDEETGDVITIVSAVRHNPTEYYEATDDPDGEMVYLEVKVEPGKTYGGTVSAADFYLDSAGSEANYASTAKDEVEAAGYEYFDFASRRDGRTTGYIPIYLGKTADSIKGSYVRPEAKVIGEDKKVPEFEAEFEIPAA
ncbi:MAG: hypothetical protein ACTIC1_06325 [Brevibacterium sp.]